MKYGIKEKIKMTKMSKACYLLQPLFIIMLFMMSCNTTQLNNKNSSDLTGGNAANELGKDTVLNTKSLILVRLSANTYQHISFLNTNNFGKVNCNGMLVLTSRIGNTSIS